VCVCVCVCFWGAEFSVCKTMVCQDRLGTNTKEKKERKEEEDFAHQSPTRISVQGPGRRLQGRCPLALGGRRSGRL
jgi:hypothetical protein